jgi:hypothetical protein
MGYVLVGANCIYDYSRVTVGSIGQIETSGDSKQVKYTWGTDLGVVVRGT